MGTYAAQTNHLIDLYHVHIKFALFYDLANGSCHVRCDGDALRTLLGFFVKPLFNKTARIVLYKHTFCREDSPICMIGPALGSV